MLSEGKLYIDGALRQAAGARVYDDISPWTGEVVGRAADAAAEDVSAAIAAARRAFDETDWSRRHADRHALIKTYLQLLRANRDKLLAIARHEVGAAIGAAFSPMSMARSRARPTSSSSFPASAGRRIGAGARNTTSGRNGSPCVRQWASWGRLPHGTCLSMSTSAN